MSTSEKRSTVFPHLIEHLTQVERKEFEAFLKQRIEKLAKKAGKTDKWSEQFRLFKLLKRWDFRAFYFEELESDFPGKKHNALLHDLTQSLKLFLACKQLEDDAFTVDDLILNRMSTRKAHDAFQHFWIHSYTQLKEKGGRGGYYFSRSLELLRSYQAFLSAGNSSGASAQNIFPELRAVMDQRKDFDAIHLAILEANFERIYKKGEYKDSFDPLRSEIEASSPGATEGLALYRLLLEFLRDGSNAANFVE